MEILNREVKFKYEILKQYQAGMVLKGTEIKSIRQGKATLKDSFIIIKDFNVYLKNAHISHYEFGNINNVPEKRDRVLLLNKKEILNLDYIIKKENLVIIPYKIYFKNNKAKLEVCLCKPKKLYNKKEDLKKKSMEKEIRLAIKIKNNN